MSDKNSKFEIRNSKIYYIDKLITWLFYSLFFLTPLVMTSFTSELFEFNKMMLIYIITVLITFSWFLKMILLKKIILKKTVLDIPIYLFLASQLVSTLFSIDIHSSLFGYYGRFNGGLLSIIAYITLFYAFVSNLNFDKKFIEKILNVSIIGSLVVILWGLPGKIGHDLSCLLFTGQFNNSCWTDQFRPAERMFSTLGQPNWLGAYLAVNLFIGLYFFIKNSQSKNSQLFYGIYLTLNFIFILFTRSRSALGAVVIGMILFFLYQLKVNSFSFSKLINKKIGIFLLSLILSVVIFKSGIQKIDQYYDFNFYKSLVFKTKQANINTGNTVNPVKPSFETDVTASSDIRKIVWKGAVELGLKYPLFGTGVETFAYSYYFVRPVEHNMTSEWDFLYNKAHNEYLNFLATTGFTGLGTYLLMIAVVFLVVAKSIKTKKNTDHGLLIICLSLSYVTILITNFFGFSTTTINLFFFLIPGLILVSSNTENINENEFKIEKLNLNTNQWIFSSAAVIIALILTAYLIRYYLADINYAKGDSYSKVGDYQKAAQFLQSAYSLKYEHVYEDKLSYVLANIAFIASYQKQTDVTEKMISTADALNKKSINASNKNVLYWKTRAKNFYLFYQISLDKNNLMSGIKALQEAEVIAPTDPKIPYSLSIFYSLLADNTKDQTEKNQSENLSLKEIDKTIGLKPDYRDGYFLKGQLLKKVGKRDEAKQTFQLILDKFNPNDEEVKKEISSL